MNSSPSARAGKLGTLTRYPDLRTDQGKQRLLRFTSSHGLPTCPKTCGLFGGEGLADAVGHDDSLRMVS
jgi:hypothetical protein